MNTRAFIRTLSRVFILSLILFLLEGCFDLGGFGKNKGAIDDAEISDHDFLEYYKEYYETFDQVILVKQDCSSNKYDISKSFFNKECVNNTRNWDSNSDCVEYNEYCYLAFKFKKDIKVDSISLYLKGKDLTEETNLDFYVFLVSSFDEGKNFRTYDKWYNELIINNSKEDSEKKSIADLILDFEDFDVSTADYHKKVSINNYGWNSFTLGFLEKGNSELSNAHEFKNGDYFVLMFTNNMGIGYDDKLNKVKFSATNLIIRSNDD